MAHKHSKTGKKLGNILSAAAAFLTQGRDAEAERQFAKALRLEPRSTAAHRGLAIIAYRRGAPGDGVEYMRRAAQVAPDSAAIRAEYARMLAIAGHHDDSLEQFQAALLISPGEAETWHYYGLALLVQKHKSAAAEAFNRCLQITPNRTETLEQAAKLQHELGRPDAARPIWKRLLQLVPGKISHWMGLAQAFWESGSIDESINIYDEAAVRFPNSPEVAMARALAYEDKGDGERAETEFHRALQLRPGWAYAIGSLLELKKTEAEPSLITDAERLIKVQETPDASRALLGFGLGKVYESRKQYRKAFEAWCVANDARRKRSGPLNRDALTRRVDRLISVFNQDLFARCATWGSHDERPIFIVGMPRSGTTLVEQIISAHPHAVGCGELSDIHRIAIGLPEQIGTLLPWPEAASALNPEVTRAAAGYFLHVLEQRIGTKAQRVTDKAPTNFFYLGLIALLFPNAHVLWCCRDPRDVCLSIYSENFAARQSYATDLEDLAFYYREQERLMGYWLKIQPLAIETVVYEELVADFEPKVRRLLDFLKLPFAAECLDFHQQQRAVLTPSRWQVRKPLYASSVGRWKHYEPWLGPLLQALDGQQADRAG